jgi:molecular chaperone DnaK
METENVEDIKKFSEELSQSAHKLAETVYKNASQNEQQDETSNENTSQTGGASSSSDDDVVDADFEEVKDDEKK